MVITNMIFRFKQLLPAAFTMACSCVCMPDGISGSRVPRAICSVAMLEVNIVLKGLHSVLHCAHVIVVSPRKVFA